MILIKHTNAKEKLYDWVLPPKCFVVAIVKNIPYGFQRQLERARAGTPVSWKKNRSQN